MKYSEWMEQQGFVLGGYYSELRPVMEQMLDENTEIVASVVEHQEHRELYNWKKVYMLLTNDKIVLGHIGYRRADDESPEGLEVDFTAIPLRSIDSVNLRFLTTYGGNWPRLIQECVVKFNDGRQPMALPPSTENVPHYTVKEYINFGRRLFQILK